jgi:hypothetical protein
MHLTGLKVLQDGSDGQVQVTVADDNGSEATYQYSGEVWSSVNTSSKGRLEVVLTVYTLKVDGVSANSASSRFTA